MAAVRLAMADLVRTFKNPKTLVIILLGIFFFWDNIFSMKTIAEQYQLGITTYIYAVIPIDWRGRMYCLILIAMLLAEAPYNNGSEIFVSVRVSRYKWFFSKILYICVTSVMFQVILFAISVLVCFPYISLSTEWGDVINTYIVSIQGYVSAIGPVDSADVLSMSPITAVLWEFLLMTLVSIMIGLLIFILNGAMKNIVGTILVGVFVMLDIYMDDLAINRICYIQKYFPTTWIDINNLLTVEGLGFTNCVVYMLLIIIALLLVGFVLVHKKVIKPVNNV